MDVSTAAPVGTLLGLVFLAGASATTIRPAEPDPVAIETVTLPACSADARGGDWSRSPWCWDQAWCAETGAWLTWQLPCSDRDRLVASYSLELWPTDAGRATWELWALDLETTNVERICYETLPPIGRVVALDLDAEACDCSAWTPGDRGCAGRDYVPRAGTVLGVTLAFTPARDAAPSYCLAVVGGLRAECR